MTLEAEDIQPQVTWGTSPQMVTTVGGKVPDPAQEKDPVQREWMERALNYMDLKPNTPITEIRLDKVFIGACTNSRIEDLRAAAAVAKGKNVAASVKLAMVVPGSGLVKAQAEKEGLDKIFTEAGFRMARTGLLDVPRHERRPVVAGRALRVDFEPQFRRTPGPRRQDASGEPGDGRGRRDCGTFCGRAQFQLMGVTMKRFAVLALAVLVVALAGCNTMRGFGQDMEKAGEAIQKRSDK